ncbi:hypothetical protein [Reichenbachiella sp. MALMAid0571]|uniref:hypothetical protein n=1 Tax=Reichenbachiella sp. MALMAid0571 TaxID=3143939 RepID=UPI0032DF3727
MNKILPIVLLLLSMAFASRAQELTVYGSPYSVDSTLVKIYEVIEKNSFKIVGKKEFASEKEEKKFSGKIYVISFETQAVKNLLSCAPTAMLDMPLKLILWNEYGDTYIGFMQTDVMKKRFMIQECDEVLMLLNRAMLKVVNDVIRKR